MRNNKIIQFGPRPLAIGEKPKGLDTTARYSKEELETMARKFIAQNAPDVKLDNLTPNFGDKEGVNYFFRWENTSQEVEDIHPFIQVGFYKLDSMKFASCTRKFTDYQTKTKRD